MFQLTSKNGPLKGQSWLIGITPLVLGRSSQCDVTLSDSLVSRRHCEIVLEGERVRLTDMASSNTTLVNGDPVDSCFLEVGDEIAVGQATFLVSTVTNGEKSRAQAASEESTISLIESEALYLSDRVKDLVATGRPKTIQDIAKLFQISRQLSSLGTPSELVSVLADHVRERLNPDALCLALVVDAGEKLDIQMQEGELFNIYDKHPFDSAHEAVSEGKGMLIPDVVRSEGKKEVIYSLLAPMALSGHPIGVICAQTGSPHGVFDEGDLEFLVALARTAAPYFRALEQIDRLRFENELLRKESSEEHTLIGEDDRIRHVRTTVRTVAPSDLNVLILGETGTGKELVAHMVHNLSPRAEKAFVVVNCAAIPSELFESELFGYEKGAFTGATQRKIGQIELAHEGTLLLDEVGDLSQENQAKLLRVIEEGKFRRLGSQKETQVNVRIVAATNKELTELLSGGAFRTDLLHRLNAITIQIPSLQERRSDIPLLTEHFFDRGLRNAKRPIQGIAPEAIDYLTNRPWPGNVRELRNCIERAITMTRTDMIQVEDLHPDYPGSAPSTKDGEGDLLPLEVMEKQHLERVLSYCHGKVGKASRILRIGRSTLYNKIASYNIKI